MGRRRYVAADAPVRVIDAFVDGLDVKGLGFGRSVPAVTGRPPYDPRDLLKLYLYGYLNEVRSSRRLKRECSRNVEVMWLLRRLAPDFKTIADFRRDNGAAIVGTCRAFVLFCRDQGLFTARLVALDGSKFRAAASATRVTVVADAGYSSGTAAAACEADGITACVPTNRSIHSQGDGTLFGRSAFVYQPEADTYMCPAGHVLARKQEVMRRDRLIVYAARDCASCSLKPRCTTAERRFVSRHLHEDALERMNARFQADPSLIRQRRCASEHPFGTIKRMTAGGQFFTRGLKKVSGEAALSVLAYNLIRAIKREARLSQTKEAPDNRSP